MKEIWAKYERGEWELIDEGSPDKILGMLAEYKMAFRAGGPGWIFRIRRKKGN